MVVLLKLQNHGALDRSLKSARVKTFFDSDPTNITVSGMYFCNAIYYSSRILDIQ